MWSCPAWCSGVACSGSVAPGATGTVTPIVCHQSVTEMLRVLASPKFRLDGPERDALLAEYLPFAETRISWTCYASCLWSAAIVTTRCRLRCSNRLTIWAYT